MRIHSYHSFRSFLEGRDVISGSEKNPHNWNCRCERPQCYSQTLGPRPPSLGPWVLRPRILDEPTLTKLQTLRTFIWNRRTLANLSDSRKKYCELSLTAERGTLHGSSLQMAESSQLVQVVVTRFRLTGFRQKMKPKSVHLSNTLDLKQEPKTVKPRLKRLTA